MMSQRYHECRTKRETRQSKENPPSLIYVLYNTHMYTRACTFIHITTRRTIRAALEDVLRHFRTIVNCKLAARELTKRHVYLCMRIYGSLHIVGHVSIVSTKLFSRRTQRQCSRRGSRRSWASISFPTTLSLHY